jgi:glycosyltransferase involved in cell wall biosynthesis
MRVGIPLIQADLSGAGGWIAGFYYVRNCLNALATLPQRSLPRVTVFRPPTLREPLLLPEHADRSAWISEVVVPLDPLEGAGSALQELYDRHPCDVVFPLSSLPLAAMPARAIGWIPDFQHRHHPEFFAEGERREREQFQSFLLAHCKRIACSSRSVLNDLRRFYPEVKGKGVLLRFTAILPQQSLVGTPARALLARGLDRQYAYLPNQFWVHKNHRTVFEAWRLLRDRGLDCLLVCSGESHEHRFPGHFAQLQAFLEENRLLDQVRILGFLDRAEQIQIYRGARVVLQPSLFEGWSTTIEEAKALGKPLIVSDIPVHREQCGAQARYFRKDNPEELADLLQAGWSRLPEGYDSGAETNAQKRAGRQARRFGRELLSAFEDVAGNRRSGAAEDAEKRLILPLVIELTHRLHAVEADRRARLEVIGHQGDELGRIPRLEAEVELLRRQLDERLEVIERQGAELSRIATLEAEIGFVRSQLGERLELIDRQATELGRIRGLEADSAFLRKQLEERQEIIERQATELGRIRGLEADSAFLRKQLEERQEIIERQASELGRIRGLEADSAFLRKQLDERQEVIERQASELGRIRGLEADIAFLRQQLDERHEIIGRQAAVLDRIAELEAQQAGYLESLRQRDRQLAELSALLEEARPGTLLGLAWPAEVRRSRLVLDRARAFLTEVPVEDADA